MAIGDYTKTTYVNGSAPAINAANLNNAENKIDELDKSLVPVGSITMYGGSTAPTGWLLCNGAAVSRTTYANLFTAIGTTWGVGDNSTTFNLPDMREASPYGVGTFSAVTGTTHGSITEHDALTLGSFGDDREQGHLHDIYDGIASGGSAKGPTSAMTTYTRALSTISGYSATTPTSDGTNGTPRTGKTTRGKIIGVNFIIKA